jgi:heptosyltransferase-1
MHGTDPQRILIIKPSSLGDIVHGLPVLAAVRRRFPRAHVAWLAARAFAPFLAGHPLLDEVIPFDRKHFGRMWYSPRSFVDFWRFVRDVRRRRFDWVIDLQGLFRSGFLTRVSGARLRAGFATAREGAWMAYNRRVRPPAEAEHAVEQNLSLARALELPVDPVEFPLALREEELAAARERLRAAGAPEAFVAVLPGARWPSKLWPAEHVAAAIDQIHAAGGPKCVLLGAPDEKPIGERVCGACRTPPIDLIGQTSLRELAAVLSMASRVVCTDSGPMHIAAALNRPLTAVFGPTNPKRTGPYSPVAKVIRLELPCSPCYAQRCPLKHHNCMRQLEAEQVVRAEDAGREPAKPVGGMGQRS